MNVKELLRLALNTAVSLVAVYVMLFALRMICYDGTVLNSSTSATSPVGLIAALVGGTVVGTLVRHDIEEG